jgi:GNAT superfamily N-acetyltransferase
MYEILRINGRTLRVRPIEVTDVDRLARMFERLSPESVRFRFFSPIPRLTWPALLRLADVDHHQRDALVALDGDEIVAVARYSDEGDPDPAGARDAELAVTVEDAWQHRGLGRALTIRLAELARARGYSTFVATILPDNRAALGLVRDVAPGAEVRFAGGDYEARLPLRAA